MAFLKRPVVKSFLKIAVTCLALGLVVKTVGSAALLEKIRGTNLGMLGISFFVTLPLMLARIYKWNYLLKIQNIGATSREATRSFLAGMCLAIFTPGRVGEFGRALYVGKGNRAQLLGLVILDRIFDLAVTILGGTAVYWAIFRGEGAFVALAFSVCFCALVSMPAIFSSLGERFFARLPGQRISLPALRSATSLTSKQAVWCLTIGMTSLLLGALQFHFLLQAFESSPLQACFLTFPIILLASILPITISGIGVREGTAALILSDLFRVSQAAAVGGAFFSFLFNTTVPALIGAFFIGKVPELEAEGQK